jgi:hypothetical protein
MGRCGFRRMSTRMTRISSTRRLSEQGPAKRGVARQQSRSRKAREYMRVQVDCPGEGCWVQTHDEHLDLL